jgi:hypothetical protein
MLMHAHHNQSDRGLLSRLVIGLLWLGVALLAGVGSGCTHKADPNPMPAVIDGAINTEGSAKQTLSLSLAVKRAADKVGKAAEPFKPMIEQLVASAKHTVNLSTETKSSAVKAGKTYAKMERRYNDYQDDLIGPRGWRWVWGIGISIALALICRVAAGRLASGGIATGLFWAAHFFSGGVGLLVKFVHWIFSHRPPASGTGVVA